MCVGAGCVCHRAASALRTALEGGDAKGLVKKVKGICSHFHRSIKVNLLYPTSFSYFNVLTLILLQGWNAMLAVVSTLSGKDVCKPPCGAETRWAGFLPMLSWVNEN